MERWEYEAVDKTNGDAFLVLKKSVYNFRFLDEDDFDLKLIEESFRNPDNFDKQISRERTTYKGYPSLDVKEQLKDGSTVFARYIIKGPHYYVIAAKSKTQKSDFKSYFNSFDFSGFQYNAASAYIDTFMHFTVSTPVAPEINNEIRELSELAVSDLAGGYGGYNTSGYFSYWPRTKNGLFKSDATGEKIGISVQEYPKYYYAKDTSSFMRDEIKSYFENSSMLLHKTDSFVLNNNVKGFRFVLRDTGSSRTISRMIMLKDNYTFSLVTMGDTLTAQSSFINSFFTTIRPEEKKLGREINRNRLEEFFEDLFSKDSATHKKAQQSISNIYYGEKGVPLIVAAIARLNLTDKDYFDSKAKLIAELGYIKDTTKPVVVSVLKKVFEQTADTSLFQNEVFRALARHKTKAAYSLFKELILQDPPVFANSYDYSGLFNDLGDSLKLAKDLFPELLQLSTLNVYKDEVWSLLVSLVDSNYITAADYESYFTKIYFDAKVELKKVQIKDEEIMQSELLIKDDDEDVAAVDTDYNDSYYKSDLDNYSVLLIPFYDKKNNVQVFFERLLQSRKPEVRLTAAELLLRNNKPVADSVLVNLAADDKYRSKLYVKLEKIKRLDKFPAKYKNQQDIARSFLVVGKDYGKLDSVVFIKKQSTTYLDKKGVVYFFKYRAKKEDDWKIGISGLQPEDEKLIFTDDLLTTMTDKKIKSEEPLEEQLQNQLKKILFSFHPSAKNFYGYNNYEDYRAVDSYED